MCESEGSWVRGDEQKECWVILMEFPTQVLTGETDRERQGDRDTERETKRQKEKKNR